MIGKRVILLSQLLFCTFLMSCSPAPTVQPDPELLYQTSTLSALNVGDFDGDVTMETLLRYGDFGLGTFNALDGEMIVLDGQVYQVRADGVPVLPNSAVETPFAAVTMFGADQTLVLNETVDCPQLQAKIDSQLPTLDAPYAIKISGEFTTLQVRAPHTQSEPYPTLADALADQVVFDLENIRGTLVGFRLPPYMADANAAGYHFHFISDDELHGGHVLACSAESLTVEIDTTDRIFIDATPDQAEPRQAALTYGLLLPFSGEYDWLGKGAQKAISIVEDDVNSTGGINGAPLQLVVADTAGTLEMGTAAAQELIDDGAIALIGPTSLSLPGVMPLIREYQIPMISPSAGTVALDQAGDDYFYRTVPSDALGGRALALAVTASDEYLDVPVENVVLMVTDDPAYLSFQAPIENGFADAGKTLTTVMLPHEADSYAEAAQAALTAAPDLIILVADPEASVKVIQETMTAGYAGQWFFTQDQTTADFLMLASPELVEGSFGLLEITAPTSVEQRTEFNQRYMVSFMQAQQPFTTNAYDAVTVMALAMLRASIHDWEITRATVDANIPLVANPGTGKTVVTSYLEGKEVLIAGGEIDYQGITGPIDFDEFGNVTQPFGIFQVQAGEWVQISTVNDDLLQPLLETP